jgi:hypothetical protein
MKELYCLISCIVLARGDHFRFGSVFIKKSNQTEIFFLKKKPKPSQTDRFRFGFLGKNRFKPVWIGFSGFGSVFSVLARFFPVLARFFLVLLGFFFWFFVGFGSVRFFRFFVYKTKTEANRPVFSKM